MMRPNFCAVTPGSELLAQPHGIVSDSLSDLASWVCACDTAYYPLVPVHSLVLCVRACVRACVCVCVSESEQDRVCKVRACREAF